MTLVTIGSGLGGFAAIAAQPTYGGTFVTPTRVLPNLKSGKATYDPHIVQGGPYLAGGRIVDIGSAHEQMYLDVKGTLSGDVMNTGFALLLATAFGSSGALTQSGTTTAYELGGVAGIVLAAPDKNNGGTSGCCFDMQFGVPTADGTVNPYNFHSCVITKAEFVFDRTGMVSYSFDWDAQYMETTTALITPTFSNAGIPFSMSTASSLFKVGELGKETAIDGVRKATLTLQRKQDVNRMYLGKEHKDLPVTNGLADITVGLEADFTTDVKTLFANWLTNTPESVICTAVGKEIGTSAKKDTFTIQSTNGYGQTGGEANLDSPEIVKNTYTYKGTINAAGEAALKSSLITADSTF